MSGGILLQPAVGGSSAAPSGAAGGDLTGTYPNPTVANGKITDAKIAAGGLTDAAIAAAAGIAQSKVATLVVDLAAKAPSANPTFTGTVTIPTPAAGDNTTKAASSAFVRAEDPIIDQRHADPTFGTWQNNGVAIGTAGRPSFYPIQPIGKRQQVDQLAIRQVAGVAAAVGGAAIYSIVYTSANTFTATLVCKITTALDLSGANGLKKGAVNTPSLLDFTTTRYIVGVNASTATTLTLAGTTPGNVSGGVGFMVMSGAAATPIAAFTDCVSWPASFTQANVQANLAGERAFAAMLVTTYGAQFI